MGKAEIEKQKQEALRARLAKKMLETQSEATPFPDKLTTLADWQCVDWTCAGDKRLLKKTLDDVPMQTDFVRDNETPNATQLHTFIRWRIKSAEDSAKSCLHFDDARRPIRRHRDIVWKKQKSLMRRGCSLARVQP